LLREGKNTSGIVKEMGSKNGGRDYDVLFPSKKKK
jgi:hypothetical protein